MLHIPVKSVEVKKGKWLAWEKPGDGILKLNTDGSVKVMRQQGVELYGIAAVSSCWATPLSLPIRMCFKPPKSGGVSRSWTESGGGNWFSHGLQYDYKAKNWMLGGMNFWFEGCEGCSRFLEGWSLCIENKMVQPTGWQNGHKEWTQTRSFMIISPCQDGFKSN